VSVLRRHLDGLRGSDGTAQGAEPRAGLTAPYSPP